MEAVRNEPIDDGGGSRPDIVGRIAYGGMTIIDLPFSIVSDTVLLPADLFRADTASQRVDAEGEPDAAHEPPPAAPVRQPSENIEPQPESEAPADGGGR
jgi:hypothetical protein